MEVVQQDVGSEWSGVGSSPQERNQKKAPVFLSQSKCNLGLLVVDGTRREKKTGGV
jgi:hypothetical protein